MPEKLQDLSLEVQFGVSVSRGIVRAIRREGIYGLKEAGVSINQISHDFNFGVDRLAEKRIKREFKSLWRRGVYWGYATEDQGLILPPGGVEAVHLIDPVDGSRPAIIGAENACIIDSIILGNVKPTIGNLSGGVVHAIKENRIFLVERGKGVFEVKTGDQLEPVLRRADISGLLSDASAVYETYSMSNEFMGRVIDPLLKEVSFKTEFPSGSYSALTLVRGQNELDIDLRRRVVVDYPNFEVRLKSNSKALFPMDVGACLLMIKELGGVVTDGYGNSLDDVLLWEFNLDGSWTDNNQISLVAAATPELHDRAMEKIKEGFSRL